MVCINQHVAFKQLHTVGMQVQEECAQVTVCTHLPVLKGTHIWALHLQQCTVNRTQYTVQCMHIRRYIKPAPFNTNCLSTLIYYSMLSGHHEHSAQCKHRPLCAWLTFRLPSNSTRHFFAIASSEEGVAPDASPPHSCSSSCSSHRETTPNSQTPLMNQDSLTAL